MVDKDYKTKKLELFTQDDIIAMAPFDTKDKTVEPTFITKLTCVYGKLDPTLYTQPIVSKETLEASSIAIEQFNKTYPENPLFDQRTLLTSDVVACEVDGFSGDSLDHNAVVGTGDDSIASGASCAIVRTYAPHRHLANLAFRKGSLKDRWHAALAFYLEPQLAYVYLMFWCPYLCKNYLGFHRYTQDDLVKEIHAIPGILKELSEFRANFNAEVIA